MIEEFEILKQEANEKMDKAIIYFKEELKRIKTGRASIAMIEDIKFNYYGNPSQIKTAASLSTPDPHSIIIDAWDKSILHDIEKGISEAGLGFNASNDGKIIRVSIPPLTEERKLELVKYIKHIGEDTKVVLRNARRDINSQVKKLMKDGHVSEDDERNEKDYIQKVTDNHSSTIEKLLSDKEKEIMEV